jgi:hypothetical protein
MEGGGMALTDETGVVSLTGAKAPLLPLLGVPLGSTVVLFDGHVAALLAATTPIGLWTPP